MSLVTWLSRQVGEASVSIATLLGGTPGSYCELETAVDDCLLISRDGGIVSILRWEGSSRLIGEVEFESIVSNIASRFAPSLKKPGHVIQVVFNCEGDERSVTSVLDAQFQGVRAAAKNLRLAVDDILDDRYALMSKLCSNEFCHVALWTRPTILSSAEGKAARLKQKAEDANNTVVNGNAQKYDSASRVLIDSHRSFVEYFVQDLKRKEIHVSLLDKHQALRSIRSHIDADFTADDWKPTLPGDRTPVRAGDFPVHDVSNLLWPPLVNQLVPREPIIRGFRHIQIGNRLWAPIVVNVPQTTPMPFQDLFNRLRASKIPWRLAITISGHGMGEVAFNEMASSTLQLGSRKNVVINKAFEELKQFVTEGGCAVGLRMCATTHADNGDYSSLTERASRLARALQGWGGNEVSEVTGNPLLGFFSTVPGFTCRSVAPVAVAPINEALKVLPWHRPASPWDRGNLLLRTPDGKAFPYKAYSSLQDAWVALCFAPMGSGKSVLMNSLNFGLILDDSNETLPMLRILDIGPSSSGLISLLQFALPTDRSHLAKYYRVRMTKDYAWNPCDTPLGQRIPLSAHRAFLINLLTLIATPLGETHAQDGVDGLASMALDRAYIRLSDGASSTPKSYTNSVDRLVDDAIRKHGIRTDSKTTWWEIVDALHARGDDRHAAMAQRYAVPTLADIGAESRRTEITAIYKGVTTSQETFQEYFGRKIIEAIEQFPILGGPTRFDLGDSSVVSLDLDEVAPKGSPQAERQTTVMYLLSLWMLSSDFFVGKDILPDFNPAYLQFHTDRIKKLSRVKKRLCADELHRPAQAAPVALKAIEQMIREGRKWQVDFVLASQRFQDFPEPIVDLSTSIFIMKPPATGSEEMCKIFQFNESERYAIDTKLLGPVPGEGVNLVARFITKKGNFSHLLTSSTGGIELWAFSTTSEDKVIRDTLYGEMAPDKARRILARKFPGGSAKSEVERRQAIRSAQSTSGGPSVTDEILAELREMGKRI